METTTHRDYLKENADNVWFVLGAYFFAFFPWAMMNNIDFISEKWRTCRRTRELARMHLVSSIFPIIYVTVYAEAQRRHGDNKELGAALAALMFNVFQLMRTIMGWIQLNAFVAWCKHAVECMEALVGDDFLWRGSMSTSGQKSGQLRRMATIVRVWENMFKSWCERGSQRFRTLLRRDGDEESRWSSVIENGHRNNVDGSKENDGAVPKISRVDNDAATDADSNGFVISEAVESPAENTDNSNELNSRSGEPRSEPNTLSSRDMPRSVLCNWENDENAIENKIRVNNLVVDNELGGREVTVLPSWEKIWSEARKGRFTPSKWLRTDRVILSTVRWGGAYLCGVGNGWSVDTHGVHSGKECGEVLESFFAREMSCVRRRLQHVEWGLNMQNDVREFVCIHRFGDYDTVELSGEMSAAYGNHFRDYDVEDTSTVCAYAFDFNSLVGSYPTTKRYETENRERIGVELVHSVLLAKHLGVEKLQAIRDYYDGHRVRKGTILRNAFKLLLMQTSASVPDDARIWKMFEPLGFQIPIFPYRMQMVGLWDEAMNWRVLQASAHQDISSSLYSLIHLPDWNENEQYILRSSPRSIDIFDYCAKWTMEQITKMRFSLKSSLGVVLETVRSFLAEWITESGQEPNWEPEIPSANIEFNMGETTADMTLGYLIWVCQRELQRKVALTERKEENFLGNPVLIMLFLLGFPLLGMKEAGYSDVLTDYNLEPIEASTSLSSISYRTIDLGVRVLHAWTPLAPQNISLMIQIDKTNCTASLRLENNSGDARFIWQDWVDAAMGCLKGFEEDPNHEQRYGRKIVKAELEKSMVELCPLHVNEDGIEAVVRRTRTARVWRGWPAFDVRICKFEVDQWLGACDIGERSRRADGVIEIAEGVIEAIVLAENEQPETSTQ